MTYQFQHRDIANNGPNKRWSSLIIHQISRSPGLGVQGNNHDEMHHAPHRQQQEERSSLDIKAAPVYNSLSSASWGGIGDSQAIAKRSTWIYRYM